MGMCCDLRVIEADDRVDPSRFIASGQSDSHAVSLEKAWHGLHFLLTGTAMEGEQPLNFLLLGGEPIGADESTRRLSPEAVREVQLALSSISDEQLWNRFDSELMTSEGIYPEIWDEPEEDLKQEYLMYFHELKRLIAEAATAGNAVLISIG